MEERRDRMVGETVDQAKRVAKETERLAASQARLAAEEVKDVLAPARPALQEGAGAAGLALVGTGLLLLPFVRALAKHPFVASVLGGAAVGLSFVLAANAIADFPPDLKQRIRELLRNDLGTAVDAATTP